ncbi:4-diphosphocytidyl-2C-methyl-D-erythritol kinase [Oceanibaculum pacificum]|uniref:4-diphosphocytidyl-2-C-methyl-D-erythritol kinase n=2 Tax=Oceanibaculum pacificum TaxID=580166 RepID=A0A154WH36_9PROT|nr:4-(cytidine 5'-diphospho)-2-C-methyl-D-erythritol kinase [Oceanibaculum pacificum]KZD12854.1 4-diphosphocytidyl-2C-methyl-D-erythritol kinase [Oceanibaculum pacificum]
MTAAIGRPAPAKLNLFLHVTGRRADGYHLLDSLVAFAGQGDHIEAAPSDQLSLKIDGPFAAALSAEPDNLVLRAARLLAEAAGRPAQAALRLTKTLPVASGIGGGSADAAAALHALMNLWKIALPEDVLAALALQLGADVPVCLLGRSARLSGVGETLEPVALPALPLVLVNPGQPLSTPAVFKARQGPFGAPAPEAIPTDPTALVSFLAAQRNDLASAAIALLPAISDVLDLLQRQPGCLLARMSGSGPTCFALMQTEDAATEAAHTIGRERPGWWAVATRLTGR